MENWFLHGNIILVSMVKYIIGNSLAVIYVSPIMGFFLTFIGGLTGVLLFTWGGFWIKAAFGRLKFSKNPGKKKNHSKLFLWLKNNGNIGIIALLTPLVLSIPVGCFLAVSLNFNKLKILLYMIISLTFWGILIFGVDYFCDFKDIL